MSYRLMDSHPPPPKDGTEICVASESGPWIVTWRGDHWRIKQPGGLDPVRCVNPTGWIPLPPSFSPHSVIVRALDCGLSTPEEMTNGVESALSHAGYKIVQKGAA